MTGAAAGAHGFGLPASFWSRFHAEHWERRATVLRGLLPAALASPEEVFGWLVEASEAWRDNTGPLIPEFFVEHAQLLSDVGCYLPGPRDGSAAAWAARATAMLDGRRFGLAIDDLQVVPQLWLRLREFLRPLFALMGVPGEQVRATAFLGNYRRTPFGLHRGRPGSFMFVIDGHKRIRAWPDEFFQGKPDLTNRTDYEPYLEASTLLDAEPGDVIYWPSSYWHIGEDAGGWSVAISLFVFPEDASAGQLAGEVARAVEERLGRGAHRRGRGSRALRRPGAGIRAVAGRVRQAVETVRALGRDPALEQMLVAARLDHLTGYAFRRLPPPRPARPLADRQVIRGHPEFPILWQAVGAGDLVCSVNGRSFAIPANPKVVALLRRINSGAGARVGDLVGSSAGRAKVGRVEFEASRRDVRALLEQLDRLRALDVDAQGSGA
jgi:hypothetical protein